MKPYCKRRWFQYSLRSLLLFVTACAIACSWLAVTMQNQRKQRVAAEAIERAGGWARFEPTWLGNFLRDDSLVDVTAVGLSGKATTDGVLVHLQGLSQLQELWLDDTKVTDAGLVNLEGLSQVQWLLLDNTQITDVGLAHLQGLRQLQGLDLRNTKVTDEGIRRLQEALPQCDIRDSLGPAEAENGSLISSEKQSEK